MSDITPTTGHVDEEARRRFESLWQQGKPRPIEEFLPAPEASTFLPTLEELVHIELEFAWKTKASPPTRVESYLARFPALNQPAVLIRLVRQEFHVRKRAEDNPTAAEYRARFPQITVTEEDLVSTYRGEPTLDITRPPVGSPSAPPAPSFWTPGGHVGRYQLCVEYARGGMGLVWRATDPNLGREVALKQLNRRSMVEPQARARFVAEARIAAQLEHPGVVPVYDLGGLDENAPYYAMKLVRGRTLTEEIRRFHEERDASERGVEQLRLLNAFLAVTRAMAYAHSRGVIHRDLKPDNIILGDYGETVILDWGLAKITSDGGSDPNNDDKKDTKEDKNKDNNKHKGATAGTHRVQATPTHMELESTEPGAVMGTPAYMSPEQAQGGAATVDERSDIFALGAILYQLITGQRAFPGKSFAEVIAQVRKSEPVPPRSVSSIVPRPLEAVCLRALAKKPEDRYGTAAQLAGDLERFLADEPVSAYRERATERLGRWVRRHKTLVTSSAVAALLLFVAGVGLLVWLDRQEQARLREASERLVRIRSAREADSRWARAEVQAGRFESAERILTQGIDRIPKQPDLDDIRAQLEEQRSRAVRIARFYTLLDDSWSQSFNERDRQAIATCEEGLRVLGVFDQPKWWAALPEADLTEAQRAQLKQDVYQMFHLLACLHVKNGLMNFGTPTAARSYRAGLEVVARIQPVQPSQTLRLVEIFCYTMLGEREKIPPAKPIETIHATDEFFLGMVHFWIHLFPDNFLTKALLNTVAKESGALAMENRLDRSLELLRSATIRDPAQSIYYLWLGVALLADEDYAEAELAFGTAVALRPNDRWAHNFRATGMRVWVGKTDDADERKVLCQRGLRYVDRAIELGPSEPSNHYLRADLLAYLDQRGRAVQSTLRYLELQQPLETIKDWREARGFFGLISPEGPERGNITTALTYAKETLAARPDDPDARTVVALASLRLGKPDDAFAAADPLPAPPALPRLRAVRGTVLLARGERDRALADFEAVIQSAPENYLAAVGKAAALEQQTKLQPALAAYDHVLQVAATDWQRFEGYTGRARVLIALEQRDEARRALDQARSINTSLADALVQKLLR